MDMQIVVICLYKVAYERHLKAAIMTSSTHIKAQLQLLDTDINPARVKNECMKSVQKMYPTTPQKEKLIVT